MAESSLGVRCEKMSPNELREQASAFVCVGTLGDRCWLSERLDEETYGTVNILSF